jgi:hypothetical protein
MRPSFLSTFGMATDQGGKLGLGKNKAIICMYSTYQVHSNLTYKCAVWMCVFDMCHYSHWLMSAVLSESAAFCGYVRSRNVLYKTYHHLWTFVSSKCYDYIIAVVY